MSTSSSSSGGSAKTSGEGQHVASSTTLAGPLDMMNMTAADIEAAHILVQMANSGTQAPADSYGAAGTMTNYEEPSGSDSAPETAPAAEAGSNSEGNTSGFLVSEKPASVFQGSEDSNSEDHDSEDAASEHAISEDAGSADSASESQSAPRSPTKLSSEGGSENDSEDSENANSTVRTRWNRIIPELSRTVPVGNVVTRRTGRGRQALSTPTTSALVSHHQRSWRVWAIRQHLGEPVGITDGDIRNALVASGCDLGTALRRMNDVLNQARQRHRANAPSRTPAEQQRDRLLGADSLHHNRRLGIDFLYTRLVQVMRADQVDMLTTLRLGQLLADHRFDVDEAVNAFLERLLNDEDLEQHRRLERRLRMVSPNQLHIDQRIARFMEIAGTDDYFAARGLLMTHGYDMLRAMDHWMRHGLAAQPIPSGELTRLLFRAPRRLHTDAEDLWPHPRPLAGRLVDIDAEDLADANADYGHPSYPGRFGWMVRYPRNEARIGVNVPTRRRCDYIRLGQFRVAQVNEVGRNKKNTGIKDPFDYNNSDHVTHLNNEVNQWFRRISGETSKEKGAVYQDDENEWIWWWHNKRLWELIEQHPELLNATTAADWPQAGVRWPLRTDTRQLARDFNHRWTQQTHLPGMNGRARSSRDYRSLDSQRKRIKDVYTDFGFPYSPPHGPKKTGLGEAPPQYSPSGSSEEEPDDDGQPSDDDQDDNDPAPPKKKVKRTPKASRKDQKSKQKADHDAEEEQEGPESGDSENDSPAASPAKKRIRGGKKGNPVKRKRADEDEDDSDSAGPASASSRGKRGRGGTSRSGRE